MTAGGTLGAFVSQVCGTVASFDRPFMDLTGRRLYVSADDAAKVRTVATLARAAGLQVSEGMATRAHVDMQTGTARFDKVPSAIVTLAVQS